MKCIKNHIVFLSLFIIWLPLNTYSWEEKEHRILAEIALDSALSFYGVNHTDSLFFLPGNSGRITISKQLQGGRTFGEISAIYSEDDMSPARCHNMGLTINQQLEFLTQSCIDNFWNNVMTTPENIESVEVSSENVVYNYLLYHIMALRFAELSGQETDNREKAIRCALICEAAALSYLSDSFSAGHLLLVSPGIYTPQNSLNRQITHDFFCTEGVFVINSKGDCWRTFGDKLLQWYAPSYSKVMEACVTSLIELLLVYYQANNIKIENQVYEWTRDNSEGGDIEESVTLWLGAHNGKDYYSRIKMPSLLHIPMPVAATWSVRTKSKDKYGIYKRRHYPQVYEEKYYDPDLDEIDLEFSYNKNSFPDWMIPEFLPNDTLRNLVRFNPDIASVRYRQERYLKPSFRGLLFSAGYSYLSGSSPNVSGALVGLGWGFADEFLFLLNKPSVNISAMYLSSNFEDWILLADFGFGLNLPILGIFKPGFGLGWAWGFNDPLKKIAGKYTAGFDTETIQLGATYSGITFRLKYQWMTFDQYLHGPVIEIILH